LTYPTTAADLLQENTKFVEENHGKAEIERGTGKCIPDIDEQAKATTDAEGRQLGRAAYEREIAAFARGGSHQRDIAERWRGLSDHWRAGPVKKA
jgi:transposase